MCYIFIVGNSTTNHSSRDNGQELQNGCFWIDSCETLELQRQTFSDHCSTKKLKSKKKKIF